MHVEDQMNWYRDGLNRRAFNDEIGAVLSEGRMWDGDRQYVFTDIRNTSTINFYVTETIGDNIYSRKATNNVANLSIILEVKGLDIKILQNVTICGINYKLDSLLDIIASALIALRSTYDRGHERKYAVRFIELNR